MSNQYPQPGWNRAGSGYPQQQPQFQSRFPQQPHHHQPYPPQQQGGAPDPWPTPKKKRTGLVVTLVLVVVLLAGGGVGVWLWQGGGGDTGSGSDPSADLPANESLQEMAFPDPNSFGYGEGSEAMCAALNEKMRTRGYEQVSGKRTDGTGLYCRFLTPGLSLLKEGSIDLRADIAVWKDNAEQRYAELQEGALSQSEQLRQKPEYTANAVERFPVGDAGFIFHREGVRTDTEAYFRSGEYLMLISVWGTEKVSLDPVSSTTLPAEVTYGEITGILMTLSGEGEPSPPRIIPPEQEKNPLFDAMADLRMPEKPTAQQACPAIAAATAPAGLTTGGGAGCTLSRGSDDWRDHTEGYVEMNLAVRTDHYPSTGNILATEELARDVQSRLSSTKRECTPLYSLPFAETGYAVYCGNILWAGFVVGGETYVDIEYSGHRVRNSDLEAVPVDEVMGLLVTVVTAMADG